MNYILHLFLNHLPLVEQEVRYVDGEEQECLIIPTKINQLKKGRQGNWLMTLRINEEAPNAKLITHTAQLGYLNWDEVYKARDAGYYERSKHIGRMRVHDRTPAKKIDRTNKATDIRCDGVIVLSDIPKKLIFRNGENAKRYISNLAFRAYGDSGTLYTGAVCIDDIPRDRILTNADNGKKYINVRFKKMESLDTYLNTHQLVIVDGDGAEIEIGRFKEWVRPDAQKAERPPREGSRDEFLDVRDTEINQRQTPESIDGMRF